MTNEEMLNRYSDLINQRKDFYPEVELSNSEKVANDEERQHLLHELDMQGFDVLRDTDGAHILVRNEDYATERNRIMTEGSK